MAETNPTIEALRVEMSNLQDDLAAIESCEIFALNKVGDYDGVKAIRHRIAEIDIILKRHDNERRTNSTATAYFLSFSHGESSSQIV